MSGEPGYCVIQWPGFLLFIGGKMKEQIQLSDHFTYGRLIRFTLPSIGMMIFMSIYKLVRQIFERMKAVPKSEIVNVRYKEKMDERRALLRSIRADYTKAAGELAMLRAEVIKSLRGESAFSQSLLGSLIADAETKCLEVQQQLEAAQAAYDEGQAVLASLNSQYDDIISWADMYDTASIEAKKMIVNCLIKRVDVYRDYKLHIDFNIDFEQFSMGLDIVWIAA